jgi:Protein of unknown function (DUF732)
MIARAVLSAAAAATVVGVLCAPIAAADPGSFLDELSTNGVSLPGKTAPEVVAAGVETCAQLRSGASVLDEMDAVEHEYQFSQGTLFVSAATTNLCPDFAG